MRWQSGRRSSNVSDRRGSPVGKAGGLGLGGIVIVLIGWFLGIDPGAMLGFVDGIQGQNPGSSQTTGSAPKDEIGDFISVMLASNEDAWQAQFKKYGITYRTPRLEIFSNATRSACGAASSASGPFYCPGDQTIYIDPSFINDMKRMGAPGDFAFAYVIAHEYGHHISYLTGVLSEAHRAMQRSDKTRANQISVRLELQADCYAGVWAANLQKYNIELEPGDIEEGLKAARAVGDDRIMASAGQTVRPENFTHGSSEQRMQWFQTGLKSGDMRICDTFR